MANEPKGGYLRYKCRMCGEEFQNTHVPDIARATSAIIHDWPNPWPQSGIWAKSVEPHYHKDGSYGMAEFIGATLDT